MVSPRLDHFVRRLRHTLGAGAGQADGDLLRRFVTGRDEAAFEVLVWRHGALVLGVCARLLRHTQDAEDVFQATFLILARRARSIRRPEVLAGWLCRTATRLALRCRARQTRQTETVRPLADVPAAPSQEDDGNDLAPILHEELDRLPEKYRLPLVLCYFQHLTTAEAALRLGCPRGTVCTRLASARQRLRRRLQRRGVAPAALGTALTAGAVPAAVPPTLATTTARAAVTMSSGSVLSAEQIAPHVMGLVNAAGRGGVGANLAPALALFVLVLLGIGAGVSANVPVEPPEPAAPSARAPADGQPEPAPQPPAKPLSVKIPELSGFTISPNGKWLAVTAGKSVKVLDVNTGQQVQEFPSASSWFRAVAFHPDSKSLAIGKEYNLIEVWGIADGKMKYELKSPNLLNAALAFSADGKQLISVGGWRAWLAIAPKEPVRIQELPAGKEKALMKVPSFQFGTTWFSPGGQYLAGIGEEQTLKVFDLAPGKEILSLKGQVSVAFSADNKRCLALAADGTVSEWSLPQVKKVSSVKLPVKGQLASGRLALHPKGHVLAVATSASLEDPPGTKTVDELALWEFPAGKLVKTFAISGTMVSLAFTPNGERLAAAGGGTLHVWPVADP